MTRHYRISYATFRDMHAVIARVSTTNKQESKLQLSNTLKTDMPFYIRFQFAKEKKCSWDQAIKIRPQVIQNRLCRMCNQNWQNSLDLNLWEHCKGVTTLQHCTVCENQEICLIIIFLTEECKVMYFEFSRQNCSFLIS